MTITVYGDEALEAVTEAASEINRLDALLSAEDEESEIYAINETGSGTLSEDTAYLVQRALEIAQMTDGSFNIAVYPLMVLWGFPSQEYTVPDAEEIEALLPVTDLENVVLWDDGETLSLENGAEIDLGGIVKGYLSDRMEAVFDTYDVTGAVCSLGGNIYVYGLKTDGSDWNIGIQDPEGDTGTDVIAAVQVHDISVITSGGYERYFEEDGVTYHHILDPDTGYPADSGLLSATIISEDGTLADALSTALFVMGEDDAAALWRQDPDAFDFILVKEDGSITVSEGISERFSVTDARTDVTVVTAE